MLDKDRVALTVVNPIIGVDVFTCFCSKLPSKRIGVDIDVAVRDCDLRMYASAPLRGYVECPLSKNKEQQGCTIPKKTISNYWVRRQEKARSARDKGPRHAIDKESGAQDVQAGARSRARPFRYD